MWDTIPSQKIERPGKERLWSGSRPIQVIISFCLCPLPFVLHLCWETLGFLKSTFPMGLIRHHLVSHQITCSTSHINGPLMWVTTYSFRRIPWIIQTSFPLHHFLPSKDVYLSIIKCLKQGCLVALSHQSSQSIHFSISLLIQIKQMAFSNSESLDLKGIMGKRQHVIHKGNFVVTQPMLLRVILFQHQDHKWHM